MLLRVYESSGNILTDGEIWGYTIDLAENRTSDDFYETTLYELRKSLNDGDIDDEWMV